MYKLTNIRLKQAKPILDGYTERLVRTQRCDVRRLEMDLRDCWGIGYQSLKGVMRDMLYRDEYKYLAAYYMEHSNSSCVVSEFQTPLAQLYGVERWTIGEERDEAKKMFWDRAFTKMKNAT